MIASWSLPASEKKGEEHPKFLKTTKLLRVSRRCQDARTSEGVFTQPTFYKHVSELAVTNSINYSAFEQAVLIAKVRHTAPKARWFFRAPRQRIKLTHTPLGIAREKIRGTCENLHVSLTRRSRVTEVCASKYGLCSSGDAARQLKCTKRRRT